MVLKITVKTLDSQNYQFEANEDWTVAQFKEHIQDTVNVVANEQRLIFCGRVLQNDLKLTEYDCNGKVIHLVRRPPPTQADEESNRRTANETQNDRFRVIPHLEGTFTITATTIDTSLSSNRPQATATIFLTQADPNQPGIRIPVTIPLAVNPQQPPVIRTQTTDSTPTTATNSGPNILGRSATAPLGQDPLMNMIPELAINAASHILSGVLGFPINATGATQQQQQQQQQQQPQQQSQQQQGPRQASSNTRSMMDIDIDDDSSPQPQSRYHETRRVFRQQAFTSNSPSRGATFEEQRRVSSSRAQVLLEHPDWIPIIEFDINRMANQSNSYTRFSDAYLSSIPKKRRRVLMATPDRVPVLQPSPSQAIVDILRRSVMNSNSPSNNLDHLLESLANDTEVQSAYEEFLRAMVSNRLKSDRDFCPSRYKHTNEYFATVTVEPGE